MVATSTAHSFQTIVDKLPIGVAVIDQDGHVTEANDAFLAKQIVQMQQGEIYLDSAEDEGTTVEVLLRKADSAKNE